MIVKNCDLKTSNKEGLKMSKNKNKLLLYLKMTGEHE